MTIPFHSINLSHNFKIIPKQMPLQNVYNDVLQYLLKQTYTYIHTRYLLWVVHAERS